MHSSKACRTLQVCGHSQTSRAAAPTSSGTGHLIYYHPFLHLLNTACLRCARHCGRCVGESSEQGRRGPYILMEETVKQWINNKIVVITDMRKIKHGSWKERFWVTSLVWPLREPSLRSGLNEKKPARHRERTLQAERRVSSKAKRWRPPWTGETERRPVGLVRHEWRRLGVRWGQWETQLWYNQEATESRLHFGLWHQPFKFFLNKISFYYET